MGKNNNTAVDLLVEQIEQYILTHGNLPFNVLSKFKKQAKTMSENTYTKEDVLKAGEIGEINHFDYKHIVSLLDEAKQINNMITRTSSLMDGSDMPNLKQTKVCSRWLADECENNCCGVPEVKNELTAVEWLIEQFSKSEDIKKNIHKDFIRLSKSFEQAKEIEKKQMKEAVLSQVTTHKRFRKIFDEQFEKYYREKYGK